MANLPLVIVLILLTSSRGHSVLIGTTVVVSRDGTRNYTTIQDAVWKAPNNTDGTKGYFQIHVTAGIYKEYINIPEYKKYLMMIGDGINRTVITGNHSKDDGWATDTSATFTLMASNFVAMAISFRNMAGPKKGPAVAVQTQGNMSVFYRCSFEAYQDTLWTKLNYQFYHECDIFGTVDFIFGDSTVVFQNCNLYPRLPFPAGGNTITAQSRSDERSPTGMSFHNCSIKAADDLASSNISVQTYLGRPWREYARVVFMQSFMDNLINPAGWDKWDKTRLELLYYAEFENRGPGANTKNRVKWPGYHVIGARDAANFTVSNYIRGDSWLPQTGVP